MLKAMICESRFKRKANEYSVWLTRGLPCRVPDKMPFKEALEKADLVSCVHTATTSLGTAMLVQRAFNVALAADSELEAEVIKLEEVGA